MGDNKQNQPHPQGNGHHNNRHPHHNKNHHQHHHGKNHHHNKSHSPPPTRESLWTGAEIKTLEQYGNLEWQVEMTGIGSASHTVYARAVHKDTTIDPEVAAKAEDTPATYGPTITQVVESVVDVAWKHVAKQVLSRSNSTGTATTTEEEESNCEATTQKLDLDHVGQSAFPPASKLLQLGAIWLVNEASYCDPGDKKKHATKKKRLMSLEEAEHMIPDWKDYVLRVHYAPHRYHALEQVDWTKYCRGLLVHGKVQVHIGRESVPAHAHVPASLYPDNKDGVIVYEDAEHGFCILNKPGAVPDHATVDNHGEDVLTVFSHVLQDREKEFRKMRDEEKEARKKQHEANHQAKSENDEEVKTEEEDPKPKSAEEAKEEKVDEAVTTGDEKDETVALAAELKAATKLTALANDDNHHHTKAAHLSLPLPLDTETHGLVIIATKRQFGAYLTSVVDDQHDNHYKNHEHDRKKQNKEKEDHHTDRHHPHVGVTRRFQCLVCVKDPEEMKQLNNWQENGTMITHYFHFNPNHPNHLDFLRTLPEDTVNHQNGRNFGTTQMRIVKIGHKGVYAANVSSDPSVGDARLAQRLWGLGVQNHSKAPADDLGIQYVAHVEVEQVVTPGMLHTHMGNSSLSVQQMISGQWAALGFPLVGDKVHGGGTSEFWANRHGWNRMALQCCQVSFPEPKWVDNEEGDEKAGGTSDDGSELKVHHHNPSHHHNQHLASSQGRDCCFRLNEAWWTHFLEQYHVQGI